MTRKTCPNQPHVDIVLQSVCPELYGFGYSRLRCRKSVTRQRFIGNHSSFLDLDDLCRTADETALKLFLKINETELNQLQINTRSSLKRNPMTRNKMPRTRTSSVCYKMKQSSLSPDFTHRLRTRRHTTFVNNFADTSGDDDSNHVKPMRELRSSSKSLLVQTKTPEHEQDTWSSGRPKRTCIKQKRISADERLVVDNKTYYKVEVMTNKLRSSGILKEVDIPVVTKKVKHLPHPVSEESEDDKGLLKFRKLRNSELTVLNNEAENFLFPRKDESSSEEDTDADGSNTSLVASKKGDNSTSVASSCSSTTKPTKNSKNETEEETSMDSTSSETSSVTRKRRRLTQAEAFILDNQRYYKFETPGSRLRYQGSYLAPVAAKNNGEYSTNKQLRHKDKEKVEAEKTKLNLDDLKFSFEVVPKTESWYKTFQRQDKGEEFYASYTCSESGFYEPFLLPYEMGPLPPLDPRACMFAYRQTKKRFLGDTVPTTSAVCSTPESSTADTSIRIDELSSTGDDTKSSEDSAIASELTETFRKSKQNHPRRGLFVPGKNPRKSPRQHASTLAILSSLIHQRKRRETHKSRSSDQNASKNNLSAIAEEEKEQPELELDYDSIAKNINEMLSNVDQFDEVVPEGGVDVGAHYRPDAIHALEDVANYQDRDGIVIVVSKPLVDAPITRKPGRKKKKNRTGWPNKNRRTVFRKEGSDSRDGLGGSEQDNSIANSPSVNADSNEETSEDNNCNKNSKKLSLSKLSNYIDKVANKTNARSTNSDKLNGDKLNGVNDGFDITFKPKRKEHRESSSDNCAEVVIASDGDKIDCVNVDLDKWENAERVLAAKLRNEAINNDIQFQPIVRVQKLDSGITVRRVDKQQGDSSPSPRRTRPRRMPASPKSPRMLRRPRGGWYREKHN